jgi:hypothetical protein
MVLKIETDEKGKILGQLDLGDNVAIVIQKRTYGNKEFIDIRKYVVTSKYKGFTPKGLAIEPEFIKPLAKKLLELKLK